MNLMALGMFVFSLPTLAYQELARERSWRHARAGRVGALDAVQFTGRDNDEITLSGDAPAELMAGRASIDQLVDMAKDGAAWPLVAGTGAIYGNFVITKISERHTAFFADGTPRLINFTLTLLEVDAQPAPVAV
ncbi:phage tail protein [Sphingomonas phyllosphaerae]|uniref:phage tail protein n=1 Tax=Sphingomonas phyllosphaerae TaxID=257003 RepID=UPI0004206EED|nr:phage tail protein [Sphingomonas phyllosphaerae]